MILIKLNELFIYVINNTKKLLSYNIILYGYNNNISILNLNYIIHINIKCVPTNEYILNYATTEDNDNWIIIIIIIIINNYKKSLKYKFHIKLWCLFA